MTTKTEKSFKRISEYGQASENTSSKSNFREPLAINEFVEAFAAGMTKAFVKDTVLSEEGKEWIQLLYNLCILNPKKFKDLVPLIGDEGVLQEKYPNLPAWVSTGLQVKPDDDSDICIVIRGTSDAHNIRPFIHALSENSVVPVMTIKVLQAVVSIICVNFKLHNDLEEARLAANVFKACKIEEGKRGNNNWGIHGHAGMCFVANFVNKERMIKDMSAYPEVKHFIAAAIRFDNMVNPQENLDGTLKKSVDSKKGTLGSLYRTLGMPKSEFETHLKEASDHLDEWFDLPTLGKAAFVSRLMKELFKNTEE